MIMVIVCRGYCIILTMESLNYIIHQRLTPIFDKQIIKSVLIVIPHNIINQRSDSVHCKNEKNLTIKYSRLLFKIFFKIIGCGLIYIIIKPVCVKQVTMRTPSHWGLKCWVIVWKVVAWNDRV